MTGLLASARAVSYDALGGLGSSAYADAAGQARFAALRSRAGAVQGILSPSAARSSEIAGAVRPIAPETDPLTAAADVAAPRGTFNGIQIVRSPEDAARLYEKATDPEFKKIRETADQFVSILYSLLFKEMDKTIERTGLTGGGKTEEMFRSFVLDEYAKSASSQNANNPVSHRVFEMLYERTAAHRTAGPLSPGR